MKHQKLEEYQSSWDKTKLSPTTKLKIFNQKSNHNKSLKINTLLQTPLVFSQSKNYNHRSKHQTNQVIEEESIKRQSKELMQSINSSKSQNKFGKKSQEKETNHYKNMVQNDLKYLQQYKISVGKYQQAVPNLKWPYLFTQYVQQFSNQPELFK